MMLLSGYRVIAIIFLWLATGEFTTVMATTNTPLFSFFVNRPFPVVHNNHDMIAKCKQVYMKQPMNPFAANGGDDMFQQRYFLNDDYYEPGGPMFFYLGNEADVTLYVNATGLMWENAPNFHALVVFAEHRYYGKSQLYNPNNFDPTKDITKLQYLTSEQALMDYVELIQYLMEIYNFNKETDAVIGFGGSYGGMLASWARYKYPHIWDGVIAASAPIVDFEGIQNLNPNFYAEGVTYDVSRKGGVSNGFCEINLRKAFANLTLTRMDPKVLRDKFQICQDDTTSDQDLGMAITNWISEALSYMSMGNFPYESSYILNGDGVLPAFPIRVACQHLADEENMELEDWLQGLAGFASVYYNYTQSLKCNTITKSVNPEAQLVNQLWNYQYCSEIFMVLGQTSDANDLYWNQPWNGNEVARDCYEQYGFYPNRYHFFLTYGDPILDWASSGGTSNIVWSQGEYDPWRGGGVTSNLSDSLLSIVIPQAAHHLDLFFSHPHDTPEVKQARTLELAEIQKWINAKKKKKKKQTTDQEDASLLLLRRKS